jgi:hypothetical protein
MADTVASPVPGPYRWTMQHITDIEQVLREKKLFTLRCMLDGIQEL